MLKPWLNDDYIRQVRFGIEETLTFRFVDGGYQTYHIDDCTYEQLESTIENMKKMAFRSSTIWLPVQPKRLAANVITCHTQLHERSYCAVFLIHVIPMYLTKKPIWLNRIREKNISSRIPISTADFAGRKVAPRPIDTAADGTEQIVELVFNRRPV